MRYWRCLNIFEAKYKPESYEFFEAETLEDAKVVAIQINQRFAKIFGAEFTDDLVGTIEASLMEFATQREYEDASEEYKWSNKIKELEGLGIDTSYLDYGNYDYASFLMFDALFDDIPE